MTQPSQGPLIVLTTGGTGGHMFPAEALAAELQARGCRLALITDRRGATWGGALADVPTWQVAAGGIAGRGLLNRARGALELAWGTFQAWRLLRRLRPVVVVGFGGYASVPAMMAARRAGLPTALHEQNAVLGRANRLFAGSAARIAASLDRLDGVPATARNKVTVTGMPVRDAVVQLRDTPYPPLEADGPVRVAVFGGSQGARVFSDVLPLAMDHLPAPLRRRLTLVQQCREEDLERVRAAYAERGVTAELAPFFRDLPRRLAEAHLVIGRAGASTVAELTTLGRPAVLIPYPHAVDDHQTANAHALDEAGGGWLMRQEAVTPEGLAGRLEDLLALPATLPKAAACAHAVGRPRAAADLADMVLALIPETPGEEAAR